MELSAPLLQLLSSLGIPAVWLVPLTALLVLLIQRFAPNLKLPTTPKPTDPQPVNPTPVPAPAPLLPNLSDRPVLSLLLSLFALKASGAFKEDDQALASLLLKDTSGLKKIEVEVKS